MQEFCLTLAPAYTERQLSKPHGSPCLAAPCRTHVSSSSSSSSIIFIIIINTSITDGHTCNIQHSPREGHKAVMTLTTTITAAAAKTAQTAHSLFQNIRPVLLPTSGPLRNRGQLVLHTPLGFREAIRENHYPHRPTVTTHILSQCFSSYDLLDACSG